MVLCPARKSASMKCGSRPRKPISSRQAHSCEFVRDARLARPACQFLSKASCSSLVADQCLMHWHPQPWAASKGQKAAVALRREALSGSTSGFLCFSHFSHFSHLTTKHLTAYASFREAVIRSQRPWPRRKPRQPFSSAAAARCLGLDVRLVVMFEGRRSVCEVPEQPLVQLLNFLQALQITPVETAVVVTVLKVRCAAPAAVALSGALPGQRHGVNPGPLGFGPIRPGATAHQRTLPLFLSLFLSLSLSFSLSLLPRRGWRCGRRSGFWSAASRSRRRPPAPKPREPEKTIWL